jgi:hypothetical protein
MVMHHDTGIVSNPPTVADQRETKLRIFAREEVRVKASRLFERESAYQKIHRWIIVNPAGFARNETVPMESAAKIRRRYPARRPSKKPVAVWRHAWAANGRHLRICKDFHGPFQPHSVRIRVIVDEGKDFAVRLTPALVTLVRRSNWPRRQVLDRISHVASRFIRDHENFIVRIIHAFQRIKTFL